MIHLRGQIGRFSLPNRDNDSTKEGILEFWLGDLKFLIGRCIRYIRKF